jgi:hypothetical protein
MDNEREAVLGNATQPLDEEEEDAEELFGDNFERDYRPLPHLDVYDPNVVDDDGEYENMTMEERAAAEREMRRRDRQEARSQGRNRPGLLYGTLPYMGIISFSFFIHNYFKNLSPKNFFCLQIFISETKIFCDKRPNYDLWIITITALPYMGMLLFSLP